MSESDSDATVARPQVHAWDRPVGTPGSSQHVLANVPGLTYRQLDFWTRTGILTTITEPEPGSGFVRMWRVGDYPYMRRILALGKAGIVPSVAAEMARNRICELAPGIVLTFSESWMQ